MNKNKKAESLAGVIVGVLLISLVVLGLYNLVVYSNDINDAYEHNSKIFLLKGNTLNILYKIGTSTLQEGEIFYLNKNYTNKEVEVFTGATNEKYKYVDEFGDNIDKSTYSGEIFERSVKVLNIDDETGSKIFDVSIKKYNG